MDPIRFAIDNPVKVTVAVLLLVIFGMLSLLKIPVQLVPNVDQPVVTVETRWTGRSPEEIEREIIEEQEDKLKSVSSLRKMTATCSQGKGEIKLEFYVGADQSKAFQEVSDKLREVPEYPDGVDEPVISAADTASENAIAWMIMDSQDPDFDMQAFFHVADKRVKPYLERVSGLSRINVFGGRDREVQIQVDPHKLALRGITFTQLHNALRHENLNVSAGDITDGRLDVRIRTVGQYDNLNEIRQTVVAYTDGGPIRIKDLGDAVITLEKRRSFVRANGKPALAINAIRETDANVISVMQGLRGRIDEVNAKVLKPYKNDKYKIRLRQVYDETTYINAAIDLVQTNLVIGGILAGVILLLFLRTIRPTMVIALAIPVSVIGTFVVMVGFGRNLNVISLAGLAFAVGMVVDNAIVVLENIDRHLSMGQSPREAAYNGTREVWGAILASTLTTLAVFIPVLTIQEEAGQLFRDISLAICAAVTLSLIVSVTVIPSASARWLKPKNADAGRFKQTFKQLLGITAIMTGVVDRFANTMRGLMGQRFSQWVMRLGVVALFVLASVWGAEVLMPSTSYLPNGNKNLVFGIMLTPPAYNLDQNQFIGERIEKGVKPYWQAKNTAEATAIAPILNFMTGEPYPAIPAIKTYFFVSFSGTIFMGCSSADDELVSPLGSVLSGAMGGIPGSFGFAQQASIFGRGVGGANSVEVEISSNNLDTLRQGAQNLYMGLTGTFGFRAVRPSPLNFNLTGPEIRIRPNYVKASELQLNLSELGTAVGALVDGVLVGNYRLDGESVDLRLIRHPDVPLSPDTLHRMPVAYTDRHGQVGTIPLSAITKIEAADAPQQILRIEELRSVSFQVTPPPEKSLEDASNEITEMVNQMKDHGQLDPQMQVNLAGTADKLVQVRETLLGKWEGFTGESLFSVGTSRMVLALLITFLLMAALFESFVYPLVIMFSVPLAAVGGFGGLALVRLIDPFQQLDMLTMLGFVILIGVVVNNAILIVHQALNFMRGDADAHEKLLPRDAIAQSIRTRIRPIFMTTLTSVCGMLPLILMPGSGSELYRGLGSVVVGGLIISTLFTLIVVPLVFSIVLDLRKAITGKAV